jgi:ABC-type transport system substrate-binding protein
LDQVSDPAIAARLSEPHPLRPHFARSSSAGHRWSAGRDTSWPTRITSSGRHINGQICAADAERALAARSPNAAGTLWADIDRKIVGQAPWVPLYNPHAMVVVSARVGNYQFHPLWRLLIDQLWVR